MYTTLKMIFVTQKNHLKAYLAYKLKNIDMNLLQIHNNYV